MPDLSQFVAALDTQFRVRAAAGNTVLRLVEAKATATASGGSHRDSFMLLFVAPRNGCTEQGIFSLEHDTLGAFDAFMVPVDANAGYVYFEAIFSL